MGFCGSNSSRFIPSQATLQSNGDDAHANPELADPSSVMEICGILFKCSWTTLLCSEFVFQTSIWGVELSEDHCLRCAIFCYTLIVRRSNSNSQLEIGSLNIEDHVTVEIDTVNGVERGADDSSGFQSDYSNHHQQTHSLRRRLNDGYNWRKYEEKIVKGSEKQRSYYKCPYTNCPAKKRVERSSDGQIIEVLYKGTHIHYKPNFTMKRNSSFETLHAIQPSKAVPAETPDQSFAFLGNEQMDLVDTPENSSISI